MSNETGVGLEEAPQHEPGIETRRLQAALTSKMFGLDAAPAKAGRFVIEGHLGSGAMGTVYRARDPELDRVVAVKVLRPKLSGSTDTDGMARLRREGQALARLSHPHVVEILDVGEEQGQVFIAMEFVAGHSLAQWATQREGDGRFDEVLRLAQEAAAGLVAAHAVGIVHRDIKPHNMLVAESGRLKLADFGLARAPRDGMASVSMEDMRARSGTESLTGTGYGAGTPAYMAPEQFYGEGDARSDQFAFCVSFWEVAFGARPFAGETIGALRRACARGEVEEPRSRAAAPRWFQSVLRRGLRADPDERFASMAALAQALEAGAPSHRRVWVAGAALSIGVAAVAAVAPARDDVERCADVADAAHAAWSTQGRAAVTRAASSPSQVEGALELVDGYIDRWVDAKQRACEAAWEAPGGAGGDELDITMLCLNRRLARLETLVEVVRGADDASADIVGFRNAVQRLPQPAACSDTEAIRAEVAPPVDPARAARVEVLERELQRLLATEAVAPNAANRSAAEALVEQAREVAHGPFLARALVRLGEAQTVDEDPAAVETFAEAAEIASQAGTYRTGVGATISAGVVEGRMGRHAEAERFFRQAEALLPRVEHRELLASELVASRASVLHDQGKYAEVVALLRPQVEVDTARGATGREALAGTLETLGRSLTKLGQADEAVEVLARAVAVAREEYGPDHREVATLLAALGTAEYERGDGEASLAAFEESMRIVEQVVGKTHPIYGQALGNVGTAHLLLGDRARAEQAHRQALAIFDETLPPSHPVRTIARVNIIEFVEDDAEAERLLLEALTMAEEHLGADSVHATSARSALGGLYRRTGRTSQALVALHRALKHHEAFGRERRALGDRTELARAYADAGDWEQARVFATRAVADARAATGGQARAAGALVALAIVERAAGHDAAARALLEEVMEAPEQEEAAQEREEAAALLADLSG